MSDLRERLVACMAAHAKRDGFITMGELADAILTEVFDDEPLMILFEGSADVYYRLREVAA